jgi:hypothetical protein
MNKGNKKAEGKRIQFSGKLTMAVTALQNEE